MPFAMIPGREGQSGENRTSARHRILLFPSVLVTVAGLRPPTRSEGCVGRSQFVFTDILKFIDEQGQGCLRTLGGQADGFQKYGEIIFQVTVVCQSGFGFQVNADFDILIAHLECFDEAGQTAQGPLGQRFGLFLMRQAQ